MRRHGWPVLAVVAIAMLLVVITAQHRALEAARAEHDHRMAVLGQGLVAGQQALERCQQVARRDPQAPGAGAGTPPAEFIPLGGRP
ncbi:MAG: hypothetical protein HY660_10720 [Armatimonadetes bacterium]|nr:hypothetical protein [Armatimonadota bacterium]